MSTRIARMPLTTYDDEGLHVVLLRNAETDRILSIESDHREPGRLYAVVAMEVGTARLPNDTRQRIICVVAEHTIHNVWRAEKWRSLGNLQGLFGNDRRAFEQIA